MSDIERRGIPAVFVASAEFADAAARQATALGFDAAWVLTEHPIQDRTDAEMREIADNAVDELVTELTNP